MFWISRLKLRNKRKFKHNNVLTTLRAIFVIVKVRKMSSRSVLYICKSCFIHFDVFYL